MLCTKFNKNGAKIPSKTTVKSTSQLGSILEPTWLHFGRVLGAKLEPRWHQIAPKVDSKKYEKKNQNLDATFDQFLSQLGSILGGFGDPSWGQVDTKSLRKSILKLIIKMITFRIALGTDFDRFSAPRWAPRGGPRNHFSRFLGLLGPSWGQDGPKIPPRTPKTPQELP